MKKPIAYILLFVIILSALGLSTAYATNYQPVKIPKPHTMVGPTGDARNVLTQDILPRLTVGSIGIVGAMSLLFLIIGGVRFSMVYGNEEAAQTAKKQVIYALVGLILALLSYAIVSILSSLKFEGNTTQTPIAQPTATTSTETEATPPATSPTTPTPAPEPVPAPAPTATSDQNPS